MPARDLHDKPFDEGTKTKLAIYRSYIRAWLQVFLHATPYSGKEFHFFDFFCGPGQDSNGVLGSPLILIDELLRERVLIEERRHEVKILFNDKDKSKVRKLEFLCAERSLPWKIRFESLEFQGAFEKAREEFGAGPSLVFIDQNGVKHITKAVFDVLTQADTTDFLFFTASSFKWRFGDLLAPEIAFPDQVSYLEVHRVLADLYRDWAPRNFYIGHFSIKKAPNIYGLIFGSQHWRGLQKFLEIAWKLDAQCGEADYELEEDTDQAVIDFEFGGMVFKKRKVEIFQDKLVDLISAGKLKTDEAVVLYCLVNGFLPRVSKNVYIRLRNDGVLRNAKTTFPRSSVEALKAPRRLEL
jgi:hypothetical protein